MPIAVLPGPVAARIAAGEVIERPASVVKELVENSLDAGANRIAVAVLNGGRESITVTDDGHGIAAAEVETAFERFATSKISSDDALMAVETLGFRGEALPSIASVAIVEVRTATSSGSPGVSLRLEFGDVQSKSATGSPRGSEVSVRSLFQNVPARRRFMGSASAELGRIHTVLANYATARPDVAFEFSSEGEPRWATDGSGRLRSTVAALYGAETASRMLDIGPEEDDEEETADYGLVVSGLIGAPPLSRGNRGLISLSANGRWFLSRRLTYAVEQAYQGFLGERRYPIAFLALRIPTGEVDVNVHPTKSEVRFLKEHAVFGAIQKSVRGALLTTTPVPSASPSPFRRPLSPGPVPVMTNPMWPAPHVPDQDGSTSDATDSSESVPPGAVPTPVAALPILRLLGQAHETYLIAEGPGGLFMIDQHAAHERVLYEEIVERAAGKSAESQQLLIPESIVLSAEQESALETVNDRLAGLGFSIEEFGPHTTLIRGVPQILPEGSAIEALVEIIDGAMEGVDPAVWLDRTYATLACHSAVTAGRRMNDDEARELVRRLEQARQPNTCPHGRPTMIHMSESAMEREFHRR